MLALQAPVVYSKNRKQFTETILTKKKCDERLRNTNWQADPSTQPNAWEKAAATPKEARNTFERFKNRKDEEKMIAALKIRGPQKEKCTTKVVRMDAPRTEKKINNTWKNGSDTRAKIGCKKRI